MTYEMQTESLIEISHNSFREEIDILAFSLFCKFHITSLIGAVVQKRNLQDLI